MTEAVVNPLAALIQAYRRHSGTSYRKIADRAGLPHSTVHSLASKPIKEPPKLETLEKLAVGLEMELPVVQRAAQEAAGFHLYSERTPDSDTEILIGNYQRLGPAQRAAVAAMIDAFLREEDNGR